MLPVTYNKQHIRRKPFSDAVAEQQEDHYTYWPMYDAERSVLWVLETMEHDGIDLLRGARLT